MTKTLSILFHTLEWLNKYSQQKDFKSFITRFSYHQLFGFATVNNIQVDRNTLFGFDRDTRTTLFIHLPYLINPI